MVLAVLMGPGFPETGRVFSTGFCRQIQLVFETTEV